LFGSATAELKEVFKILSEKSQENLAGSLPVDFYEIKF